MRLHSITAVLLCAAAPIAPVAPIASEVLESCRPALLGKRAEVRFFLTPVQARATLADGTFIGEGRFSVVLPVGSHTVRVMLSIGVPVSRPP